MQDISPVSCDDKPIPVPVALTSTLPTGDTYPGYYGFQMSFQTPPRETKSTPWTYSASTNKLFVRMGVSVPLRFRCSRAPPVGSYIRAMPVYAKSEHAQEVVRRCPNHMSPTDPSNQGHPAPAHLLRCEHEMAVYTSDSISSRMSVLAPMEQPQIGAEWATYLYQFMCFSSCTGGLNRRPLQVVFTLENGGQVLGRSSVEVRICACPGRDKRVEEKLPQPATPATRSRPAKRPAGDMETPSPKRRHEDDVQVFTLTVTGRDNYETLCRIRDALHLAALIPSAQATSLLPNLQPSED